jgi:cell division protease FtsH
LAHCATHQGPMFMPGTGALQRDCSEETAREIDEEVKRILDLAYVEAKDILLAHREYLETVTAELLKRETLDSQVFNQLLGRDPNTPVGDPTLPVVEQVQEVINA